MTSTCSQQLLDAAAAAEVIVTDHESRITANTSDISSNSSAITTNTSNISTNTSNISTNTADIAALGAELKEYATLHPAHTHANITLSNGNLTASTTTSAYIISNCNMFKQRKKWYWENTIGDVQAHTLIGIDDGDEASELGTGEGYGYNSYNGNKRHGGTNTAYGNSFTTGDIIGVALDLENGMIWWSKNGVWQASGDPGAGSNPAYSNIDVFTYKWYPCVHLYGVSDVTVNFGASSFTYTVPTGFNEGIYD